MRWPASRHETLLEIERLIRQFEPRLQIVNVSLMEHENPNRITVLIEAEFEDGAFCAKTELTSLGGVTVRPSEVG
jgi:predicted component of type VI protein secretion system